MRPYPKNPRVPRIPLTLRPKDLITYKDQLWRIHTTTGTHPSAWNELRHYGPLTAFRWDPHPPPPQFHGSVAVSYAASGYATTFAEVFQRDHQITLTSDRTLSGWVPTRPLQLLDLVASDWAVHHGASASLPQADRNICRGWANAISEQLGDQVDGLFAPSTVIGDPMIVLFARSSSAFPIAPAFSRNLDHPDVATLALRAGTRLDWPVL